MTDQFGGGSLLELARAGEHDLTGRTAPVGDRGRQSGRRGGRPRASGIGEEAGEDGAEAGEEGELPERRGWRWRRERERSQRSSGDGSSCIAGTRGSRIGGLGEDNVSLFFPFLVCSPFGGILLLFEANEGVSPGTVSLPRGEAREALQN
jgi:hypothetical protein